MRQHGGASQSPRAAASESKQQTTVAAPAHEAKLPTILDTVHAPDHGLRDAQPEKLGSQSPAEDARMGDSATDPYGVLLASVLSRLLRREAGDLPLPAWAVAVATTASTAAESKSALASLLGAAAKLPTKSMRTMLEGLHDIANSLEPLQAALQTDDGESHVNAREEALACMSRALHQLRVPAEVKFRPGEVLLVSRRDVHGLVDRISAEIRAEQWETLGGLLGDLLVELHASPEEARSAAASTRGAPEQQPLPDMDELAAKESLDSIGVKILIGFAGHRSHTAEVVASATLAVGFFRDAVADFEAATLLSTVKGLAELAEGIFTLAQGLQQASLACSALDLMQNPQEVVLHVGKALLVERKEVLSDVDCMTASFRAERWEEFGGNVRALLDMLTSEELEKAPLPAWTLFLANACCGPTAVHLGVDAHEALNVDVVRPEAIEADTVVPNDR